MLALDQIIHPSLPVLIQLMHPSTLFMNPPHGKWSVALLQAVAHSARPAGPGQRFGCDEMV